MLLFCFSVVLLFYNVESRILDNLPVAVLRQRRDGSQSTTYEHGFRVGFKGNYAGVSSAAEGSCYSWMPWNIWSLCIYLLLQSKEEKYFINNHLSFRVMYHKDPETDSARIVGFEVTPNRFCHFHFQLHTLCFSKSFMLVPSFLFLPLGTDQFVFHYIHGFIIR